MKTSRIATVLAGALLAATGCASDQTAKDYEVLQAILKQESMQTQRRNAELEAQVRILQQELGKARSAQAREEVELRARRGLTETMPAAEGRPDLQGPHERLRVTTQTHPASSTKNEQATPQQGRTQLPPESHVVLEDLGRDLEDTNLRLFDLEGDLLKFREQNLSQVENQLERDRRDIQELQARLGDTSTQISNLLGAVQQKLDGRLEEQTTRSQDAFSAVGKKVDERLETQEQRVATYDKRLAVLEELIKAIEADSRATATSLDGITRSLAQFAETMKTAGLALSSQVDQHAAALSALEEARRQVERELRSMSVQLNQVQKLLATVSKTFDRQTHKDVDRPLAEMGPAQP